jgi:N-acetylmuramoyl-L-alanine amidase
MATEHIVKQGEYLAKIAAQYGFSNWKPIWEHPDNAALKTKRKSPNVLLPGDSIVIPEVEAQRFTVPTGQVHRFQLKRLPLQLRLVVKDFGNQPLADTACTLEVKGKPKELVTDGAGMVELPIPRDAEDAVLTFKDPLVPFDVQIPIKIGHLDPADTLAGQKARLRNLGYFGGLLEGPEDDAFRHAVQEFQCDHDLAVDGVCGPLTQAKLEEEYGC